MEIRLFNSLTHKKEVFEPIINGEVSLYACGPTVYASPHIGNLRTYIFEDILRRTLENAGYKVKHIENITDVGHLTSDQDAGEDKLEKSSQQSGETVWDIAEKYTQEFKHALNDLNILEPTIWCKATDHIEEQKKLAETLWDKGFLYETADGLYFDTSKLKNYNEFNPKAAAGNVAGARVEKNDEKKSATDFAVWKFSAVDERRQMEWSSPRPFENKMGWPGWHLECSAMSTKYLGQPFDIHCGGVDHLAIHHPNEIAQSEAATETKMCNFWLHGEFLLVDGGRMGKSEGNAFTLVELSAKGFDPMVFRYGCLLTHYRQKMNFTWDALQAAKSAYETLSSYVWEQPANSPVEENGSAFYSTGRAHELADKDMTALDEEVLTYLADDLNTPEAMAAIWRFVKSGIPTALEKKAGVLSAFNILGLSPAPDPYLQEIPTGIKHLLDEREAARQNKDWEQADHLRKQIGDLGYLVEDTAQGQKIRKI